MYRYKIKLEVRDPTSTATCVLFEKEAHILISEVANSMISESANSMINSVKYDNKEVPKQTLEVCGQTLIFQLRRTTD